jgi:hypothetical protein
VDYIPSTLDHEEEALLAVEGELAGSWEYLVRDRGLC